MKVTFDVLIVYGYKSNKQPKHKNQNKKMSYDETSQSSSLYILLALIFLTCYLILTSLMTQKHFPVHRTAVAIIVGIIAGLVMKLIAPAAYKTITKLDQFLIYSVLFPPMIFAQGYTLHKSVFFRNIKYILVFGLIGTFISFGITWGLIYQANEWEMVRDSTDYTKVRTLSDWQILLVSACLCSIDTLSAQQTVCQHKYPRLYSVIFGEDLLKDAVTIVLFGSILGLEEPSSPTRLVVSWITVLKMLGNFVVLIAGSVFAGIVFAFGATYLCKKMRFMTKDKGVSQTGFLFLVGFFLYILSEMLGFSGSISLLLYGILLNHYNIYNMSPQSRHASVSTFTLLSNICQGALFLIMGIMVWQGHWQSPTGDDNMTHSWIFFFVVFLIVVIARIVNIYVLGAIAKLIGRKRFSFSFEEMHILFVGGLVRGAVPFVLFTSVQFANNNNYLKNQGAVLKTTIIFIIIFTSIVINSLVPFLYKKRAKYLKRQYKRIGEVSLRRHMSNKEQEQKQEELMDERGVRKSRGRQLKGCEERYIKKVLILDYEARRQSIKEEKKKRMEQILIQAQENESDEDDESDLQSMLTHKESDSTASDIIHTYN